MDEASSLLGKFILPPSSPLPEFKVLSSLESERVKISSFDFSQVILRNKDKKREKKLQKKGKDPLPPALYNCYGRSSPNDLLAILGPCASDQTDLLHVLGGKHSVLDRLQSGGRFMANETQDLFAISRPAFVLSDPHHFKQATVLEEFRFAAAMKCPIPMGAQQDALINDLLLGLDLVSFSKTLCKLLKPTELRRVAIGVALLSLPNILLVDQPLVSDQDRRTDWQTIRILQRIHRLGICQVVVSLLAPKPEIFDLISNHFVHLTGNGQVLWMGNASGCQQYLSSRGRGNDSKLSLGDYFFLCAEFSNQTWPQLAVTVNKEDKTLVKDAVVGPPRVVPLQSMWVQFTWLFSREMRYLQREYKGLLLRFSVIGILMGLVAIMFTGGANQNNPYYNVGVHFGSFVFPLLFMSFGAAMPTAIMLSSFKPVLIRERTDEMYDLFPAILTKFIVELVFTLLLAAEGLAIIYFSVGWNSNFGVLLMGFFVLMLSCNSYAYFFVFSLSSFSSAFIFLMITLGPQLLFMGTVARLSVMPAWLSWVSYVCNITWGMKVLVGTEFTQELCKSPATCAFFKGLTAGNYIVSSEVWSYFLILLLFFSFYRSLALFNLSRAITRLK